MIKGKLINLRMIAQQDLESILELTNDVSQNGDFWPVGLQSEVSFKKRFNETGLWGPDFGTLLIETKDHRMVGEITYFKGLWYMPGFEVGYRIYKNEDRGKGFTTEALKLFTAFLFESKPIHRLEIEVDQGNHASRKVAEKCGFKLEGLKRQAVFSHGEYFDIELLSLLRNECPRLKDVIEK